MALASLGGLKSCLLCLCGYCQVWKVLVSSEFHFKVNVTCGSRSYFKLEVIRGKSQVVWEAALLFFSVVKGSMTNCLHPQSWRCWVLCSCLSLSMIEWFPPWVWSPLTSKMIKMINYKIYNNVIFLMANTDLVQIISTNSFYITINHIFINL